MVEDRSQAVGAPRRVLRLAALGLLALRPLLALDYPGPEPGPARVLRPAAGEATLANRALVAGWAVAGGRLRATRLEDRQAGRPLVAPAEPFVLRFRDGRVLPASALRASGLRVRRLVADPQAPDAAGRLPGREVAAELLAGDGAFRVSWRARLRDGSAYVQQAVRLEAVRGDLDLARVDLVVHDLPGAEVVGRVPGSPVVAGRVFTALEHPMATAGVDAGRATCGLDLPLPLRAGRTLDLSSVLGLVPEGQLRRGFLHYLERERARPYRPLLHYNSWYDIGYFTPYAESDCLEVVRALGEQLVRRRQVVLDSFLFDDGWDDTSRGGTWAFHGGFPRGFLGVKDAAAELGAEPGVWLSPWGGYGKPRIARRRSGQALGFEVAADPEEKNPDYALRFALSGPRYYESFRRACLDMVTRQGINHVKLDGTGALDRVVPGSAFGSDFEAAIALIRDLRRAKPGLFVNLTTGTWPSPFWLGICDSIWRGGEDHDFAGEGPDRERWITYRDSDTREGIVAAGPLFPLNALMLHGVILARHAKGLSTSGGEAFTHEVRSYFGSGTQLQELYVSHGLPTGAEWDTLAQAARWARARAATLVDTHWIGGDPRRLEVYGWAAWGAGQGTLTLRNPASRPQAFPLDLARALDLPPGAPRSLRLVPAFPQRPIPGQGDPRTAGQPLSVTLEPFEVLVFDVLPPVRKGL